eukprot:g2333.t1
MMSNTSSLLLLPLLLQVLPHFAKASETHPWEWAGVFTLPDHADGDRRLFDPTAGSRRRLSGDDEPLFLIFQKDADSGAYTERFMKVLFLNTDECDTHGLEEVEEEAETIFNANVYTNITYDGTNIPVLTNNTLYNMIFNDEVEYFRWIGELAIEPADENEPHFVMFSEHFPMELEGDTHFLKDAEGHDIEPCVTEPASDSSSEGMTGGTLASTVLLATFITCVCSLFGILTLAPAVQSVLKNQIRLLQGFSCGAILAAAFFLLLFEGNHLMYEVGEESAQSAVYGVSVISGILTGFFVNILTGHHNSGEDQATASSVAPGDVELATKKEGVSSKGQEKSSESLPSPKDVSLLDFSRADRIVWTVFWGDLFHNLSDGIVIASAFLYCDKTFGWTLTGATVAHEITQELADWFILTGRGRLTWAQAALLNFISSLSSIVSGMLICALEDEANSTLIGIFLSYGGGIYLYISLVEIAPTLLTSEDDFMFAIKQICGFCVGVTALGLVLLNHEHCVSDASSNGDGGHAHAH